MSKIKMRRKDIATIRRHVVAVPYCALQRTLWNKSPIGYYATSTYGWRCDVYVLSDDVALTTGYSTIGQDLPQSLYADDQRISSPEAAESKIAEIVKWARENA